MINGNPHEFIERLYTCQDTVFVYQGIKYWFHGYTRTEKDGCSKGRVHMEVFQYEPSAEDLIWEYNGNAFTDGQESFQAAPFFNGKTFWEVEKDVEWVDC